MSEGRNPVFHCYASGWPTPSFTWLKDGTEIQDGDAEHSYVLTERANGLDSGLDLDILYVRQKHAGQYSCVARNRFGKEQHHINLFLESKYPVKDWIKLSHWIRKKFDFSFETFRWGFRLLLPVLLQCSVWKISNTQNQSNEKHKRKLMSRLTFTPGL